MEAKIIESNGVKYPILLSMNAVLMFQEYLSKKYNDPNIDLSAVFNNLAPIDSFQLCAIAINYGNRKQGIKTNYNWEDIGDLMDRDPQFVEKITDVISAMTPEQTASSEGEAGVKKN